MPAVICSRKFCAYNEGGFCVCDNDGKSVELSSDFSGTCLTFTEREWEEQYYGKES